MRLCQQLVMCCSIPASALFGYLADYLVHHHFRYGRELIIILLMVTTTLLFLLQLVPETPSLSSSWSVHTILAFTFVLRVLNSVFKSPITSIVDGTAVVQIDNILVSLRQDIKEKESSSSTCAGNSTISYGTERLYGAISWAVVSLGMGLLIDSYSTSIMYSLTIVTMVPLFLTLAYNAYFIQHHASYRTKLSHHEKDDDLVLNNTIEEGRVEGEVEIDEVEEGGNERKSLLEPFDKNDNDDNDDDDDDDDNVLSPLKTAPALPRATARTPFQLLPKLLYNFFASYENGAFIISITILSIGMSIVENLLFIFFKQSLHASSFLCGLTVVVTVIFEIPIFQFSAQLLHKFGRNGLLIISMIAYGTRVIGYTIVPNGNDIVSFFPCIHSFLISILGWYVLLLEPLHGVTYGCSTIAAIEFASSVSPPGLESTSQTLMGIFRYGVGYAIGNAAGGYVEEVYGPNWLYRSAGVIILFTLAFYWLSLLFCSAPVSQSKERSARSRSVSGSSVNRRREDDRLEA